MINCKTYVESLGGKPVAVFGLGVSGQASVKALVQAGAKVFAWDDREEARDKAAELGADIQELNESVLSQCGGLIMAPGISLQHEVPAKARELGVEILSDIEILYRCAEGLKTIAVTGTNGKSTTVTLIHHILQECGVDSVLGGNIGTAALDLKLPSKNGAIVLELSSYQLELVHDFTADIGVMMNLTPDHLDRHGSIENYAAAKERILKGAAYSVVNIDDDYSKAMYERAVDAGQDVYALSVREAPSKAVFVEDSTLFDFMDGEEKEDIGSLSGLTKLQGIHNHQNAAAAFAACKLFGLESNEIFEAMNPHDRLITTSFNIGMAT